MRSRRKKYRRQSPVATASDKPTPKATGLDNALSNSFMTEVLARLSSDSVMGSFLKPSTTLNNTFLASSRDWVLFRFAKNIK